MTVGWMVGMMKSGELFPMVAVFTGFGRKETPKEDFIVIKVRRGHEYEFFR